MVLLRAERVHAVPLSIPNARRDFGVESDIALILGGTPDGWWDVERYSVRKGVAVVSQVSHPPFLEVFCLKILPERLRQERHEARFEKADLPWDSKLCLQVVVQDKGPRPVVEHAAQVDDIRMEIDLNV